MVGGSGVALFNADGERTKGSSFDHSGPTSGFPCARCANRDHSVCRFVSRKECKGLFPHDRRIQTRKAGSTLFRQGEPFDSMLIVKDGWVLIYKLFEDGRRQIIRFVLPGALIGFEGNQANGMAYSAEAITDVALCGIKRSVFFRICRNAPLLAMSFADAVTGEAMAAWNQVGALGQQKAEGRVANLLLDLHRRIVARLAVDAPCVRLPINQLHIADATGLTPVHVCRTLKRMRLAGLLEFHKGQLVVLDAERLAAVAQLDPASPLDGMLDGTAAMPTLAVA